MEFNYLFEEEFFFNGKYILYIKNKRRNLLQETKHSYKSKYKYSGQAMTKSKKPSHKKQEQKLKPQEKQNS